VEQFCSGSGRLEVVDESSTIGWGIGVTLGVFPPRRKRPPKWWAVR
jgi:hypothetical protein